VHDNVEINEAPVDFSQYLNSSTTADIAVDTKASPTPAYVNKPFTLTITVTNNGPDTASAVVLTETLPAGTQFGVGQAPGSYVISGSEITVQVGDLAINAKATLALLITPAAPGSIDTTATVATASNDTDAANNMSTLDVPIGPAPVSVTNIAVATKTFGKKKEKVIVLSLNGALGKSGAGKVASYRLAAAGKDKKYGTKDDKVQAIKSVSFDNMKNTITIRTKGTLNLAAALQPKVTAIGILDPQGRPLDGNHDGAPGGDLIALFTKPKVTF
jgi:uncharacterized repeat protein (TIGR01451 family)